MTGHFSVVAAIAIVLLALTLLAIYRLALHPLANVPGPKVAALTSAHEFYFDCIKGGGGQHAFQMRKMHDTYAFWDVLYSNTNKLDKDGWYYGGFGNGLSMVSTTGSELHRARRSAVANYFGSGHVRTYEPMVLQQIAKLLGRLESCGKSGEIIDLANAYRCLTMDVATSFVVPEPRGMLNLADFGKGFNGIMRETSRIVTLHRHLKVVLPLLDAIPEWIMLRMDASGSMAQMIDFRKSFQTEAKKTIERKGLPPEGQHPSVLDTIYGAPELADRDKFEGRIVEEAMNTVGAGTETTAATLTLMSYYILSNPAILSRLCRELAAAAEQTTGLLNVRALEQLPYLQACINEALRVSNPVTGRLPRISPRAPIVYTSPVDKETYTFPPGTVMSMSMPDIHFNSAVFPDPHAFEPSRWIDATSEQKVVMQRHLVPFGKGSRGCLGKEVASMEMMLTAGNLFHRLGRRLKLFETTQRDVSWAYDFFAPYIPVDSKGLRVTLS